METKSILFGLGIGVITVLLLSKNNNNAVPLDTNIVGSTCGTFYKNDEIMEIWRDESGYIKKTQITRNAKTGG